MSAASVPRTARVTAWDRVVVIALGGAGCALSFSALQQMAEAIHIRPTLCWLFPLVIDGFIAYGIRALLVLRTAPLRARLYVWTLFGTATAVSVWANALHAVRLNQQTVTAGGLRLSDQVVASLSTVAPLALAGAVHLYILIARGPVKDSDRDDLGHSGQPGRVPVTSTDRAGHPQAQAGQVSAGAPVTVLTDRLRVTEDKHGPVARTLTGAAETGRPDSGHQQGPQPGDLGGQPATVAPVSHRSAVTEPVGGRPDSLPAVTDRPVTPASVSDRDVRTAGDRLTDLDTEELLEIARSAVRAEDKLTRKVVAQAIRGQQIPLSSDTLTTLMVQLRQQHGQPVTSTRA